MIVRFKDIADVKNKGRKMWSFHFVTRLTQPLQKSGVIKDEKKHKLIPQGRKNLRMHASPSGIVISTPPSSLTFALLHSSLRDIFEGGLQEWSGGSVWREFCNQHILMRPDDCLWDPPHLEYPASRRIHLLHQDPKGHLHLKISDGRGLQM